MIQAQLKAKRRPANTGTHAVRWIQKWHCVHCLLRRPANTGSNAMQVALLSL